VKTACIFSVGLLAVVASVPAGETPDTKGMKILAFEIGRDASGNVPYDPAALVDLIKARLDAPSKAKMIVRPTKSPAGLEVQFVAPESKAATEREIQRVKEFVEKTGRLEFLILANGVDDKAGIEAATKLINDSARDPQAARILKDPQVKGLPPPEVVGADAKLKGFSVPLPGGQDSRVTYRWIAIGPRGLHWLKRDQYDALWNQVGEKRNKAMQLTMPWDPDGRQFFQGALFYSRERAGRPNEFEYFVLARNPEIDVKTGMPTPAIDGSMVAAAMSERTEDGSPALALRFNAQGAKLFADLTRKNAPSIGNEVAQCKRHLAIVLDGEALSAPTVNSEFGAEAQIAGLTQREVDQLVPILRARPLPVTLRLISVRDAPRARQEKE
jgi:SecD/SecF fusion protein